MALAPACAETCLPCAARQTARQQLPTFSRHGLGVSRHIRTAFPGQPPAQRVAAGGDLDLASIGLDIPNIDADLRSYQSDAGAQFTEEGVPKTFQNDVQAAEALETGAVVVDRSHWGRLRVGGEDHARFLHGQSTADITALRPGQGCDTVFVTAQGRCLDLATCLVQQSGSMLIVSPGMKDIILQRLATFILYGDKVQLMDISPKTAMLTLAGPKAFEVLSQLDAASAAGLQPGQHLLLNYGGSPVILYAGRSLGAPDFLLIADEIVAGDLWRSCVAKGAVPMGDDAWQLATLRAGRPQAGTELTESVTPLEAGLYGAVSLNKGCYIGQETLAKTHKKGIAKALWGLRLSAPASSEDAVLSDGEELGKISRVADGQTDSSSIALAYLRCRKKGIQIPLKGKSVEVNGNPAEVVELSFLQRTFAPGNAPETNPRPVADINRPSADASVAEDAAKAERLRQMQKRLAAWQAQQQGSS